MLGLGLTRGPGLGFAGLAIAELESAGLGLAGSELAASGPGLGLGTKEGTLVLTWVWGSESVDFDLVSKPRRASLGLDFFSSF